MWSVPYFLTVWFTMSKQNEDIPLMTNQQSVDVVIITALDKERDAVMRYLGAPEKCKLKTALLINIIYATMM